MKTHILHTINSGLYFWNDKQGVLMDVLHQKESDFSPIPDEIINQMDTRTGLFQQNNDLFITHIHEDHYDPILTARFARKYPDAKIYGPELPDNNMKPDKMEDSIEFFDFGTYRLYSFPSIHLGETDLLTPHRIYCLYMGKKYYLICGDAVLDEDMAGRILSVCHDNIEMAFVNVYQLKSADGMCFLDMVKPKEVWINHLPDQKDDDYHFWWIARDILKKLPPDKDNIRVMDTMQQII